MDINKYDMGCEVDSYGSREGPVADYYEPNNEAKQKLIFLFFFKNDSAPWS
jgi:hypothetical protein